MQLLSPLFPQNHTEDQSQPSWGGLNPVQFEGLLSEKECKNHKYKNSVAKCIYSRMSKRGVLDSNYGVSWGMLGFFGCSFSQNLFGSPSADLLDLQTTWVPSDALPVTQSSRQTPWFKEWPLWRKGRSHRPRSAREEKTGVPHPLISPQKPTPGPVLSSLLWGNRRLLGTRHLGLGVSDLQFPGNTSCPAPGELGACVMLQPFSQGKGRPWSQEKLRSSTASCRRRGTTDLLRAACCPLNLDGIQGQLQILLLIAPHSFPLTDAFKWVTTQSPVY